MTSRGEVITAEYRHPTAVKLWLHPALGEAREMDIYERHEDLLRADPSRYGLRSADVGAGMDDHMMAVAVANGWVRITNFNDAMLVTPFEDEDRGYITAADLAAARQGLRWLERRSLLPAAMDVEIGYGTDRVISLRGDALAAFVRRGTLPRQDGAT